MDSSYLGLDLAQIIFGVAIIIVFIFFVVWGIRTGGGTKTGR